MIARTKKTPVQRVFKSPRFPSNLPSVANSEVSVSCFEFRKLPALTTPRHIPQKLKSTQKSGLSGIDVLVTLVVTSRVIVTSTHKEVARMNTLIAFGRWVVIASIWTCGCNFAAAQTNQQRGATVGGLAGAIAGGLIGEHNDEPGAGAAIGGVIGAVAGGVLGNAADKERELARQRAAYYQAQQQQYAAQQHAAAMQSAVSLQDVVNMTRSGLGDQVIINQLRQRGYLGKLTVADIIALHQQGVSENVITSLQSVGQNSVTKPALTQPAIPQTAIPQANLPQPLPTNPRPTIVRQYVHPTPILIEEHVRPYYPPPRHHRSRHGWHFYIR